MKKFRSGIMALVIGLSISVPVSAEITVPDEVKKMSGEEGYKRGYEDALKQKENPKTKDEKTSSNSTEGYKAGEVITLKESELSIIKTERAESYNGKDAVRVFMTFKNLKGDDKTPAFDLRMNAFQDGVELERTTPNGMDSQYFTKVKAGGQLKNVVTDFELLSDTNEILLEFSDELFGENPVSVSIKLD